MSSTVEGLALEGAMDERQRLRALREWSVRLKHFFQGVTRRDTDYVFTYPVEIRGARIVEATSTALKVEVEGKTKYLRLFDTPS